MSQWLKADPIQQFDEWFKEVTKAGEPMPEAMTLATAGKDRIPSARLLLLKEFDANGFVFYTNYESRKAEEIDENPVAAMVFHWKKLERQVRIEGTLKKVTRKESQAYFETRPRESQLGAWASPQSTAIPDRETLERRLEEVRARFEGQEKVPCPPNWGGYRLVPERIEFWQGQTARLHDRYAYVKEGRKWKQARLAP